jgi:hypothetical protein
MPNDYEVAHKARQKDNPLKRSPKLPPSQGESVSPDFLLNHENHFDRNIVTPEQLMQNNKSLGGKDEVKTA